MLKSGKVLSSRFASGMNITVREGPAYARPETAKGLVRPFEIARGSNKIDLKRMFPFEPFQGSKLIQGRIGFGGSEL